MTDKRLISKTYKQLIKPNSKKEKNKPDYKIGKEIWTDFFPKENIQIAKRHIKRCSTSLIIREMQIKTTIRYRLTPLRMAIIQKTRNNGCRWGCGKGNPHALLVGMKFGADTTEVQVSQNIKNRITCNSTSRYLPKENRIHECEKIYASLCSSQY